MSYVTDEEQAVLIFARMAYEDWRNCSDDTSEEDEQEFYEVYERYRIRRMAVQERIALRVFPVKMRIANAVSWMCDKICWLTGHAMGCWLLNAKYSPLAPMWNWAHEVYVDALDRADAR